MLASIVGKEYFKANNANKSNTKIKWRIKWGSQQRGLLKINFDGSVINSKAAWLYNQK